jgi:hypothetical protein
LGERNDAAGVLGSVCFDVLPMAWRGPGAGLASIGVRWLADEVIEPFSRDGGASRLLRLEAFGIFDSVVAFHSAVPVFAAEVENASLKRLGLRAASAATSPGSAWASDGVAVSGDGTAVSFNVVGGPLLDRYKFAAPRAPVRAGLMSFARKVFDLVLGADAVWT